MHPSVLVPLAVFKEEQSGFGSVHGIRETYLEKLVRYGLTPVIISVVFTEAMIDDAYQRASGILLMGGGDIDPHAYGASLHSETKIEDVRRDALEILLAKRAEKDKKPILGICRGHQVMAVAGGGSLIQHVPEIAPGESHTVPTYSHLRDEGTGHSVILTPESRIAAVLQKTEIQVTSGHHQAVKDPGVGMRITGYSPGGIPEIIESTKERFAYGVQCHPEAEDVKDLEPLFAAFGEAVLQYRA